MGFLNNAVSASMLRDKFPGQGTVDGATPPPAPGSNVDLRGNFVEGSNASLFPGQNLEVRGLNDFIGETNRFRGANRALFADANQSGLKNAVSSAKSQAGRVSDVEAGTVKRRLATQDLSDRQQRAVSRRVGLGRAVNEASAGSAVRRNFSDVSRKATQAAGGIEAGLRDIESEGLVQMTNAAGQEKIRLANERADKKANKAGIISTVVGIGLSIFSSEDYKHDKQEIDGSLLERLKKMRVEKWKYKGDDHTNHIGPYAGEFNAAFGVGQDDPDKINVGDSLGVLLGAVKELNDKVDARGT